MKVYYVDINLIRRVVATNSQKNAACLLGVTLGHYRRFGGIIGQHNAAFVVAMLHPGVRFERDIRMYGNWKAHK